MLDHPLYTIIELNLSRTYTHCLNFPAEPPFLAGIRKSSIKCLRGRLRCYPVLTVTPTRNLRPRRSGLTYFKG